MSKKDIDLVVFGGTGDLAMRKLMPALLYIYRNEILSDNSRIIAIARSDISSQEYQELVLLSLKKYLPEGDFDISIWEKFKKLLEFKKLDVTNEEDWRDLSQILAGGHATDTIFYMAVPPSIFAPICHNIKKFQLNSQDTRIVVEKPLGENLKTAREINDLIAESFPENRIYRIDHYLGKQSIHNLLDFRFQNNVLDKIWNDNYIESITVKVSEIVGVEGRFEFLDKTGVLRDMVQNHLMQILSLLTIDNPKSNDHDEIRDKKAEIVRNLSPITNENICKHVIKAQYTNGIIDGKKVKGYLDEIKGKAKGLGETFVAVKANINNDRWKNTDFFLITGKRLNERKIEVNVNFKQSTKGVLGIELQPKLSLTLQPEINISPTDIIDKIFGGKSPLDKSDNNARNKDAYEALLIDIINKKQTYFVRRDEIEASWAWIDKIRDAWDKCKMLKYPAGSNGSKEIDNLFKTK